MASWSLAHLSDWGLIPCFTLQYTIQLAENALYVILEYKRGRVITDSRQAWRRGERREPRLDKTLAFKEIKQSETAE